MKKIIKFIMLVMVMCLGVFGLASCDETYEDYYYYSYGYDNKCGILIYWFEGHLENDCVIQLDRQQAKELRAVVVKDNETGKEKTIKLELNNVKNERYLYYDVKLKGYYIKTQKLEVGKFYYISNENEKLFLNRNYIYARECPDYLIENFYPKDFYDRRSSY